MINKLIVLKPIAWALGNWHIALGVAGAFALWSTAVYFIGRDHGKDSAEAADLAAESKARDLADISAGQSAQEAESDDIAIDTQKDETDEAIRNAGSQGEKPSNASNALNCKRLMRTSPELYQSSTCVGREGGAGADTSR